LTLALVAQLASAASVAFHSGVSVVSFRQTHALMRRVVTSFLFLCAAFAVHAVGTSSSNAAGESTPVLDTSSYRSQHGKHKVLIDDPSALANVQSGTRNAIRVFDYGSFKIVELTQADADRLISSGAAKNADAQNLVHLNVGMVDTTTPVASALNRKSVEVGDERQLHLVQFPGPIKPEWYAALEATGVKVIAAIPSNAYLVYGDRASRSRVSALTSAEMSQWDAPYLSEHKIQPSALSQASRENAKASAAPSAAPRVTRFRVQLVKDPENNAVTEAQIAAVVGGGRIVSRYEIIHYVNLLIEIPEVSIADVAKRPDVVSIAHYVEPRRFDERQNMILARNVSASSPITPNPGNYLTQLATWGFSQAQFNASGFVVDITDDGADRNPGASDPGTVAQNANAGPVPARHFNLYESGAKSNASRFVYKSRWGTASTTDLGLGRSGHGQLNMSIVGGYVPDSFDPTGTRVHRDPQGFRYGLGVAPFVRMANSVIFDPGYTDPSYPAMLGGGYASGARISTNSWGAPVGGAYDVDAQAYDVLVRDSQSGTAGNQPMLILFAAGNDGAGANTIGSPGSAKNVITVGASENPHSHAAANGGNAGNTTGADGCGETDNEANNANDMAVFSSRGPTDDGRVKPDIVAPGTHVTGISFVSATADALSPANNLGSADATFRGDGVCALPGGGTAGSANNFFPANPAQRWYTTSSGTSHSTPAVAGAAALVYQQFINNPSYLAAHRTPSGSAAPSPALVKAYLANSASHMDGAGANDTLPSNNQGMGLVNLGRAFDGVQRIVRDQVASDRFSASGQGRTVFATVASATQPIRITLAYTDAQGSTTGNAYVNNLDLRVVVNGNLYLGNVFTGANSTTGGVADVRNNLESVFIPAGLPVGTELAVSVRATNIAAQADPTVAGNNQDYALVIYNATPAADRALVATVSNTLPTGNGVIEPNECNDLQVSLSNEGTLAANAISATVSSNTPGVHVVQDHSAYANLAAGASGTNLVNYKFSTAPSVACGSTINFTQTIAFTGGTSPTSTTFSRTVGTPANPNYAFTSSSGATISTAGARVENSQDDDALVTVKTPFAFSVYGTTVAANSDIRISTNGAIQFVGTGGSSSVTNGALPANIFGANVVTLLPYWDDLDMRTTITTGGGIYSEVTGSEPNRIWKLEWRARHYIASQALGAPDTNFAVYFREGSDNFEYVYALAGAGVNASGASATVGVQATNSGNNFTQFSNNSSSLSAGLKLTAARAGGTCTAGSAMCAPTCSLDINGDGNVTASADAVLLMRYLLGFRSASLIADLPLSVTRPDANAVETFIGNAAAYDVFRRPALAASPTLDALVLLRLMLAVPDAALMSNVSIPAGASYTTAAALRANVNARCGTAF
jgi:Subtilase family